MTKSQANKALSDFLKTPADFIYLFATDSFIAKLSGVYRSTVYRKMRLQYKYINTISIDAGKTFTAVREEFRQAILEQYGKEPSAILVLLAEGKPVAGKNWSEGVFGVGSTQTLYGGFTGTDISVDSATGKLMQNGQEIAGQTGVFTSDGKQIGSTVSVNGVQYQSRKVGDSFYAGSYGTSEGAFNADGSVYQPKNAESIFQNIFSYMSFFQQLITWLFSISAEIRNNFKLMTASTVSAQQSDWIKTSKDADSLLYFALGAGILALFLK